MAGRADGELSGDERIVHALDRFGYGPRPGDVARLRTSGIERWLAAQLRPRTIEDPELDRRLAELPSIALDTAALMRRYPPPRLLRTIERRLAPALAMDATALSDLIGPGTSGPARILAELSEAKLIRSIHGRRQLEAVMTDFWFNHFNVYVGKGQVRWMIGDYEREAIRPNALGRFRDLLGAVAHHPAMLFYLDNWLSSAADGKLGGAELQVQAIRWRRANGLPPGGLAMQILIDRGIETRAAEKEMLRRERNALQAAARGRGAGRRAGGLRRGLNENYARELLELHTLGVDGGYSQQDIVETARCFTGWTLLPIEVGHPPAFLAPMHDPRPKYLLGRAIDAAGPDEGEAVLDRLARHPATARFIALKLARRFVADEPPAKLVERLAGAFLQNDGEIAKVMQVLIESPEMWSPAAFGSKVKTPLEFVASAVRAMGGRLEPLAAARRTALQNSLRGMGQPLYESRPPTGYADTAEAWASSGAMLQRFRFVVALSSGRMSGVELPASRILARTPRPATLRAIETQMIKITDEAGGPAKVPGSKSARRLRQRIERVSAGMLLASPEFQRR